jgi:hypothetical protein
MVILYIYLTCWCMKSVFSERQQRFKGKTHRVWLETSRATRAMDEVTQRVASSCRIRCPIKGTHYPQALDLSPGWVVSFMPLHVD